MIDILEIEDTIEELENGEITLKTCNDLANLYIIQKHMREQDILPDSSVDEKIDELQTYAIRYVIEEDVLILNHFLSELSKILSEMYQSTKSNDCKSEFQEFAKNVNIILGKQ